MIVFLDTEFTNLPSPELLSIGLVTLDGREHCCELDLATETGKAHVKASSDFVRHGGVLDFWGLIPNAAGTEWEMSRWTGEWLLGLAAESGTRVEVAFDFSADYELMEYTIRDAGLWDRVREVVSPVNVNSITGTIDGELAAEKCFLRARQPAPCACRCLGTPGRVHGSEGQGAETRPHNGATVYILKRREWRRSSNSSFFCGVHWRDKKRAFSPPLDRMTDTGEQQWAAGDVMHPGARLACSAMQGRVPTVDSPFVTPYGPAKTWVTTPACSIHLSGCCEICVRCR